ncbi:MAG: protein BatD [Saprospiraceae bacterium]|nr:protein BatD [Saprospiraceae bacterium]
MRLTSLIIFSFFTIILFGQTPRFYVKTDANKILEQSYVDIDFTLENIDGSSFKPPSFDGFEVAAGPNKSTSMSIVNGKVRKKITYGYTLSPKKPGKYTIGYASIRTASGLLKTKPVTIEVIKGKENPNSKGEDVFIQTILSDSIGYVGQQITLEYKLFYKLDVRSVNFAKDQEFDGFYIQQVSTSSEPARREIVDGLEYATQVVKRISLFPQQTGTYILEPVTVNLGIANKNNRSRGFFFSAQLKARRIKAEGKTIIIDNTPQTDIASFSGAIGKYSMTAKTAKRSLTTDEAIIVNMFIQGNGDNKMVSAPTWTLSDSLEIYDPNIIEDASFQNGPRYIHKKTFEYLIVPKYPGKYKITPEFTYFDTEKNDYVTLTRQLPSFNVLKGNQLAVVENDQINLEVQPIFKTGNFKRSKTQLHGSILHILFLLGTLFGVIGLIAYNKHLVKSGQRDPILLKKNKALELARLRLKKASALKEKNQVGQFYEEITIAVKKFISDKYNIPALHINNSEIIKALQNENIDDNLISSFQEILSKAETALYAPGLSEDIESMFDQTMTLFSDLSI